MVIIIVAGARDFGFGERMKSLLKITLLATTITAALGSSLSIAAEPSQPKQSTAQVQKNPAFKTKDDQTAYALGASLGSYMDKALKEQEKFGVKLSKEQVSKGMTDAFGGKSKLSDSEIELTLKEFESRMKETAEKQMEVEAKKNAQEGNAFAEKFAKEKGVKKTSSGLLYLIEKEGEGNKPKPSDTVVVNYKGTLIDGQEFDSSYKRNQPLSFRLDGVIKGWTEGLQNVKKGGKIKMVIPPELAYGENGVPNIPPNSTLVFEVELLDIKAAPADKK